MALANDPLYAEAIVFFDDENIVKEMLFAEFQAVLDGVVGIPEFSGNQYKAAYVTIWRNLSIHIVVLFELTFDKDGHVSSEWNLPLRYLGTQAVSGPDLGQGNILLMMRSDCDDDDYRQFMWDADSNQIELLTAIRDAVKRNKLGLYVEDETSRYSGYGVSNRPPSIDMSSNTQFDQDYQHQLINNIESTLKFKYEQQIKDLESQHKDIVKQLEAQNTRLQDQVDDFPRQIESVDQENKEYLDIIVAKYQKKLEKQVAQVRGEMLEQIDVKELELHYSQDQEKQLREEYTQLEKKIDIFCANAVQENLSELINAGVELIVTQTGIGSFSLDLKQALEYIENSTGFWAKQCKVSEESYLAWSKHFKDPVCQAGHNAGCPCNVQLRRVAHPKSFEQGRDDLCAKHQLGQVSNAY